jgi:hypothetical protein
MKTNRYKEALAAGMTVCYATPDEGWKYFPTTYLALKAMAEEKAPTTLYDMQGKILKTTPGEDYL